MGAKDRSDFVEVIEQECIDANFDHPERLEICVSGDGTYGEGGSPFHRYVDVHSVWNATTEKWDRLDVPITTRDRAAVRTLWRLAQIAQWDGADTSGIGDAMRGVMRAAWGEAITNRILEVVTDGGTDVADGFAGYVRIAAYRGAVLGVTP